MTVVVGILCRDGVVIGSDSSATFGVGQIRTIEQQTRKIDIINELFILAGTGQVGLGQRFNHVIKHVIDGFKGNLPLPIEFCRIITHNAINNFQSTGVNPGQYGALLAFAHNNDFFLCEFDQSNLQPELKNDQIWYVSIGSGQLMSDPFLGFIRKIFWKNGMPTINEGIFSAVWTIQHAIDLNPGGINGPISIAILERNHEAFHARFLSGEEIQEHVSNVTELERYIGNYANYNGIEPPAEIPSFD